MCYGTDRREIGAAFEEAHTARGIMDMYWRDVCIIEMKAPSQADRLPGHRQQALDYWHSSDSIEEDRPAPRWVVLCAFQRIEVWEPGRFPSAPRADFTLEELPQEYEKLQFLAGEDQEPLFGTSYKELTTEAAKVVAELYQKLLDRKAAAPETLRSFTLQAVWCLFAEDLGMIEGHPVQRIAEDLIRHPDRSSFVELGALFDVLTKAKLVFWRFFRFRHMRDGYRRGEGLRRMPGFSSGQREAFGALAGRFQRGDRAAAGLRGLYGRSLRFSRPIRPG